uniref:Uncharacterized protein n=1 Tax=Siphoviridae sp. ctMOb8 TaxID=2825460 RepID=A0A8S5Q033_9CAUD|nr:MAG TPA: hypothetical protein [Siphoviridae sp. ctMOb8]
MAKSNSIKAREQLVRNQPTIYSFDFKDVPSGKYAETLDVLFHNPDYSEAVEKRNRLVKSVERLRPGSSEMINLVRTIQQHDRKLADIMYASIVQTNLHSDVGYDFLSFSTLLKYYVDYKKDGMRERVNRMSANLDKVTFLADMLESIVTDVKADMREVFDGSIEFNQFDAVLKVLTQLRGFFKSARRGDADSPEAKLYFDYSDSINEYIEKRLKTYTAKYRKIHPAEKTYTEADLIEGLNQFFGCHAKFDLSFIAHTESGGCYIDIAKLCQNLNRNEMEIFEKVSGKMKSNNVTNDALRNCFNVTDLIMSRYKRPKQK